SQADFPVKFQSVAAVKDQKGIAALKSDTTADVYLIYAAGGGQATLTDAIGLSAAKNKDAIVFLRHRSGPVYLWYEIMSPRFMRNHTDRLTAKHIDFDDVVVDDQNDILWRLRALCGLRNTVGSRILAVGGPGGWAQPKGKVAKLVQDRWQLDVRTVTYADLGKLIEAAFQDEAAVKMAKGRAAAYMKAPGTKLDTKMSFVENGFLLDQIFRALMKEADCGAMTINNCMSTIMPISKTTACLPLSTLNDDGYLAFCESDFVVIPSGLLLGSISGHPTFLNDPTHPHHNMITLAHCTAPRRMDGKTMEPARIMTHFESDYGAAPKVDMHVGQELTCIVPDFDAKRWLGLSAEVVAHPLLPICRSQIDVKFKVDSHTVAERMPGFHWMTIYGNYLREAGYALKRVGIEWENLG
ncbi:MAG: sugar isomerase, partial [Planctomycetota bacterium]|nr:sugar isomerase [Planctomycetota bacterium]